MPRTLGDMRGWARQLEVECARYPRRSRLSLERLIAEHGEGMKLVELRRILPGGCAKRHEQRVVDRCNVGFLQLPEIAGESSGPDRWR